MAPVPASVPASVHAPGRAALAALTVLVLLAHGWLLGLPWDRTDRADSGSMTGARHTPSTASPASSGLPAPLHTRTLPGPALASPAVAAPLRARATPAQAGSSVAPTPVATTPAAPSPVSEPDAPALAPASAVLAYAVSGTHRGHSYSTQAELQWSSEAGAYTARLAVQAAPAGPPARVQTSTGQVDAAGLRPARYGQRGQRAEEATHFDHEGGRIVFSRNVPPLALATRTQDPLSAVVQVGARLAAAGRPPTPGDSLTLHTASTLELRPWVFRVEAAQTVSVNGQAMHAWWISRAPAGEHDARLDIWLAPSLGWLPVRWRSTLPGGDFTEQVLQATPASP